MSRPAPRRLSLAVGQLTERLAPRSTLGDVQRAWPDAVGPVIAREASPTGERGGTLTITCRSSVWAQELDLMGPDLVAKLNARLGSDRISALRCVASAPRSWTREEQP
jgi:predicted nucleic acid-binding Zn ribbon protein